MVSANVYSGLLASRVWPSRFIVSARKVSEKSVVCTTYGMLLRVGRSEKTSFACAVRLAVSSSPVLPTWNAALLPNAEFLYPTRSSLTMFGSKAAFHVGRTGDDD